MLIRMHLKYILQAFLYKYSSYLSRKIPTSWQCLHTMLNPTSRAHALWVILRLKTSVLFAVIEDGVSERNFSGIQQQSSVLPFHFLQHKAAVSFSWFFFLPCALPIKYLWSRDKRICTNPFYTNQIFMLYPLQELSSSNLWNVISWP